MKCECGGKSSVTTTKQMEDSVFRRRKCDVCGKCFATLESLATTPGSGGHNHEGKHRKPAAAPKPDARGIYTESAAAAVKKKKVEARRKAEDRKAYVPNYFIEDEEDY